MTIAATLHAKMNTPAATGFFAHHGIWAPGVRLFRRIAFPAKSMLISMTFLVPLLLLLAVYVKQHQETIDFARQERAGVQLVGAIEPWLIEVQKQRRLVMSGMQSSADIEAIATRMAVARARIESRPEGLDLGALFEAVRGRHEALTAVANSGAVVSGPVLQQYVDAVMSMRTSVLDASKLSLDPEQATYYLMSVSVDQASTVIESVSRSRAMAGALGREEPGAQALRELYAVLQSGSEMLGKLRDGLGRAAAAEPAVAVRLKVEPVEQASGQFFKSATGSWFGERFAANVDTLNGPGQEAVDALRRFSAEGAALLDELLAQRIESARRERNGVVAGVAACLLIAAYLFYSFLRVMNGGLGEVARHLRAMTDGDLTTSPRPWGRDEAAALMLSLSEMQSSLRGIVGEVRGASDQLVHASSEIASASADLSVRSESAAANLEESASAIEQISATVAHGAQNCSEAAALATSNAGVAAESGRTIASVVATMEQVQASSNRISEIIGVIDGIAFQTNILSLNAAVEAARAGEQGRGFAVVANEVRALAHRSAQAAKEVKQLIHDSAGHVDAGGRVVTEAGRTIGSLVSSAERMRQLLAEVSTGAAEQRAGVGQVGASIQALDQQTQQNAALVEQTAAAAESLRDQALALSGRVARFRLPS